MAGSRATGATVRAQPERPGPPAGEPGGRDPAPVLRRATFSLTGEGVYRKMKCELGVQRVPATKASGRIHTSAATVAVLPEVEDVGIQIEEKELRGDVYRAGGVPADRASTPSTPRCASPTCRAAWW
jgi:hypothetical protein